MYYCKSFLFFKKNIALLSSLEALLMSYCSYGDKEYGNMVTIRVWNYGDKLYGIVVTANLGFGLVVTAIFDVTIIPWAKMGVTIIPYP